MTGADRLLADLADGLRRRIAERRHAEEGLAAFAFREGPVGAADTDERVPAEPDWRYFMSRTLAAAGEPGTLDLLERISSGNETVATLVAKPPAGVDGGLATADRIAGIGAAGLAGRDLETSSVRLTALGSAVLAFALEWERRAAQPEMIADRAHP
ncbi:MAG TPA: hypothetical protein VFW02_00135 [Candidatus Limnocylindrales bacterium]|nr:hypothetical protein [Candidatus Limnocylindrales bacterium]